MLHLLDGTTRPAVRTGNNAAWSCPCGREAPLIAALQIGGRGSFTCPDCTRHYQVIGSRVDGRGEQAGVPVRVEERETARDDNAAAADGFAEGYAIGSAVGDAVFGGDDSGESTIVTGGASESSPRTVEIMNQIRNKVAEAGGDVFIVASVAPYEMQAEAYRCGLSDGPQPFEIVETPA
jgi:hypothetical protein